MTEEEIIGLIARVEKLEKAVNQLKGMVFKSARKKAP